MNKIDNKNKDEKLKADLEKYCQMALNIGADEVRIVPISDIVQRIRARMADNFPRGQSQHTSYFRNIVDQIPWKYTKAILKSYQYAIVAHIPYPSDNPNDFTGPSSSGSLTTVINHYGKYWSDDELEYWQKIQREREGTGTVKKIISAISNDIAEEARKDGHQFAFGGFSGTCTPLCREAGFGDYCVALKTGLCRRAGKAMPCGTAALMGLDHPAIYAKLGWRDWVTGWSVFPEDFPRDSVEPPSRTAIVLIE